jgi:hypothetical protein
MDDEHFDIHNHCHECGEDFDDSFQLIDHTLEDDEEFDPYLVLPNGYKLMLGSLLRFLFSHAEDPEQIRHITQSTYVTLFASENGYDLVDELIEDMVVKSALQRFDEELNILLSENKDDEQDGA